MIYNGSVSTIEQASVLANSGRYASPTEIMRELNKFRFPDVERHLSGRTIRGQLTAAIKAARA